MWPQIHIYLKLQNVNLSSSRRLADVTEVTVDQDERPLTDRERGPWETHAVEVCVNPKAGVMQLRTKDRPAEVESQEESS